MLLVALVCLAQTAPRAAVIDVSAPDAVYEDSSREQAKFLVDALNSAGFEAHRMDESELPEKGCPPGPCLRDVARAQQANVVVTLDAAQLKKEELGVALAALWGRNGQPLTVRRFVVKEGGRASKELAAFIVDLQKALRKVEPQRDAGR